MSLSKQDLKILVDFFELLAEIDQQKESDEPEVYNQNIKRRKL